MPIIHKLQSISEIKVNLTPKSNWAQSLMRLRLEKLEKFHKRYEDYIYYCSCIHPKSSHNELNDNICSYNGEYCICTGFSSLIFKIFVEITEADEFEAEIKEYSERDSFAWWNEYSAWKNNK